MGSRKILVFACIAVIFAFSSSLAYAAVDYLKLINNANNIITRVQQLLNTKPASGLAQTALSAGQAGVPGLLQNYEKTIAQVMSGINLLKSKGLNFATVLEALKASNLQNLDTLSSLLAKSGLSEPVKQAVQRSVGFLNNIQNQCQALASGLSTIAK